MDPIHPTAIRQHSTISSQVRAMTEQSWPQSQKSMSMRSLYIKLLLLLKFYYTRGYKFLLCILSTIFFNVLQKFLLIALTGPPASLAEQLKQVLAEREKRLGGNDSSRESSGDFSDLNSPQNNDPTMVTHHLVEEIRQAVNEANQRGR